MIYDAVSVNESRMLSLVTFRRRIGHLLQPGHNQIKRQETSQLLYEEMETLPTLEVAALELMKEAMRRADGNQSIASRLLGISQPALSKRLKRLLN
jgi:DNA-binding protein Fis